MNDHGYSDKGIERLLPLLEEQRKIRAQNITEGWKWLCARGFPMLCTDIDTLMLKSLGTVNFRYWRRMRVDGDYVPYSGVNLHVHIGGANQINLLVLSYEMNTTNEHRAEPEFAAVIAELEAYKRDLEPFVVTA